VFCGIEPVFVTITSGAEKRSMYVDGNLARSFPGIQIGKQCAGRLVVGASPVAERFEGLLVDFK